MLEMGNAKDVLDSVQVENRKSQEGSCNSCYSEDAQVMHSIKKQEAAPRR